MSPVIFLLYCFLSCKLQFRLQEEEEIHINQHDCAASKLEGGEQHTQRVRDVTFNDRCHNATRSVRSNICLQKSSNLSFMHISFKLTEYF